MRATDEDALICDFAQYYNIYDYMALKPTYAAVLACGLPEGSRIVKRMSGVEASRMELLTAAAVDKLSWLVWAQTKDAQKGKNKPASIAGAIINGKKEADKEAKSFDNKEAFKDAWKRAVARGKTDG